MDTSTVETGSWEKARQVEACGQIGSLVGQVAGRPVSMRSDGLGFVLPDSDDETSKGIESGMCRLVEEGVLQLTLELARVPPGVRVAPDEIFGALGNIGPQARLSADRDDDSGTCSLQVELLIRAEPMSLARSNAVVGQLSELDAVARAVQSGLPKPVTDEDLDELYEPLSKYVRAVRPLDIDGIPTGDPTESLGDWAQETVDYLLGGSSVALILRETAMEDAALGLLADACGARGTSIGRLQAPTIGAENLLELNRRSPGTLAVQAQSLTVGTSLYELSDAAGGLLAALRRDKPVVFFGSYSQLQAVLSGGQGGASDPMSPVVRSVPEIPVELLVRHHVSVSGRESGGLTTADEAEVVDRITEALRCHNAADQVRLLPNVAERCVRARRDGEAMSDDEAATYARRVSRLSLTLGGLDERPSADRSEAVSRRYTDRLTDPGLLDHLRKHLVGQDAALEQLVLRLQMEALSRPLSQPIRWCSQGVPAVGKSESIRLIAGWLGVPYEVIDAASLSSPHTAVSQLLGSTTGVVGSYAAGRLEKIAKHSVGACVEIMDIDHAAEDVRSALAEVFMMLLETGTAQSAKGHIFSCSQMVLNFSMNLPQGKDEIVLRGTGFDNEPSMQEVQHAVNVEIKKMTSGAWLSRVGAPVIFRPLSDDALGTVVERAIRDALVNAADRTGSGVSAVELRDGVGTEVMKSADTYVDAFGARSLTEHGRMLATSAFMGLRRRGSELTHAKLVVDADDNGVLVVEAV